MLQTQTLKMGQGEASQACPPPARLGGVPLLTSLSPGPLGLLSLWNLLCPLVLSATLAEPLGDALGQSRHHRTGEKFAR